MAIRKHVTNPNYNPEEKKTSGSKSSQDARGYNPYAYNADVLTEYAKQLVQSSYEAHKRQSDYQKAQQDAYQKYATDTYNNLTYMPSNPRRISTLNQDLVDQGLNPIYTDNPQYKPYYGTIINDPNDYDSYLAAAQREYDKRKKKADEAYFANKDWQLRVTNYGEEAAEGEWNARQAKVDEADAYANSVLSEINDIKYAKEYSKYTQIRQRGDEDTFAALWDVDADLQNNTIRDYSVDQNSPNASWEIEDISAERKELNSKRATILYQLKASGYTDEEIEDLYQGYRAVRNAQNREEIESAVRNFVGEHPIVGGITANVLSVLSAPVRGLSALGGMMLDGGEKNSIYGSLNYAASAVRKQSEENIEKYAADWFGGLDPESPDFEEKFEEFKNSDSFGSFGKGFATAAKWVYSAGVSAAESALVMHMGPPIVGSALLGLNAGTESYQEGLERGMSQGQALALGISSGIFETLFEKISLENLSALKAAGKRGFLNKTLDIAKQMFTEGSEEFFTDIANEVYDIWVNGAYSQYQQYMTRQISAGVSAEEARKQYAHDFTMQLAESFIVGALSGGMGAGRITALNTLAQNAADTAQGRAYQAYRNKVGGVNAYNAVREDINANLSEGSKARANIEANANLFHNLSGDKQSRREVRKQGRLLNEAYAELGDKRKTIIDRRIATQYGLEAETLGKSVDAENGIKPTAIASITDGKVTLMTSEGKTVSLEDAKFKTEAEAAVYNAVAQLGYDVETANKIVSAIDYQGDASALQQLRAMDEVLTYAKATGVVRNGALTDVLNATQKNVAYQLGNNVMQAEDSNRQARIAKARASMVRSEDVKIGGKKTTMNFVGFNYNDKTVTDSQRAQMRYITQFARTVGRNRVVFYASNLDGATGRRVFATKTGYYEAGTDAPHAFYDHATGDVYVDINAGNGGQGYMLFHAAHEYGHHIADNAPARFQEMLSYLAREVYGEKTTDRMIKAQLEKGGKDENGNYKLSSRDAAIELFCDSLQEMFARGDVEERLAKLKGENPGLWQQFKDFVSKLLADIKAFYKKVQPESWEARELKKNEEAFQKLADMFVEASVEAGQNFEAAKTEGLNAEMMQAEAGIATAPDSGAPVVLSARTLLTDKQREKAVANLKKQFPELTEQDIKNWLDTETALASIILNPKYQPYLDYVADPNEKAIKQNSDYPQGTVDYSNICVKRRALVEIMNKLYKAMPNQVFQPEDLADILRIVEKHGIKTPCHVCYVEDRRQRDSIVADLFINSLDAYRRGENSLDGVKPYNKNQVKAFEMVKGTDYVPTVAELVTPEGRTELREKNPDMLKAWERFNNARGMQSVRVLLPEAEYRREIRRYSKKTVDSKNARGGLRIYSFSDFEMFHLIDLVQVLTDCAEKGLFAQGYTKVNEYARIMANTGLKLNRSLIPKGKLGYHIDAKTGETVLDFDTVEGIDINSKDFFDNKDNPNIGNIVIGINAQQIRAAMLSDFIDQIIPFHTGQSAEVLKRKGIDGWQNYKDDQTDKVQNENGEWVTADKQINIYTDVIAALEAEGKEVTEHSFTEKFLAVCEERGYLPRFSKFLDTKDGKFVYTKGYAKMLVDFKTFAHDAKGTYLPQGRISPNFDLGYMTEVMKGYANVKMTEDDDFRSKLPGVVKEITETVAKTIENEDEKEKTQAKYRGKKLSEDKSLYSYEFLTSLPAMKNTHLPDIASVVDEDGKVSPKKVVDIGIKNARAFGGEHGGKVYVENNYTGRELRIDIKSIRHGLNGVNQRKLTNARIGAVIGEIVQNAIPINALNNEASDVTGTYAMAAYATEKNGSEFIAIVTVEQRNGNVNGIEVYDVTHSVNGRQKKGSLLGSMPQRVNSYQAAAISIPQLLEIVKSTHQSILSEDVLNHFGEVRNPQGHYANKVSFSGRDLAPTFYSTMERTVENMKMDKIGAASVLSFLKGRGVKDEEIKWSGIRTFLEGKKSVTKEELQQFIRENKIQIETVAKNLRYDSNDYEQYREAEDEALRLAQKEIRAREAFSHLDPDELSVDYNDGMFEVTSTETGELVYIYDPESKAVRWKDYKLEGGTNYREYLYKLPGSEYTNQAMKMHWDDTGVIAHARVQDMVASEPNDAYYKTLKERSEKEQAIRDDLLASKPDAFNVATAKLIEMGQFTNQEDADRAFYNFLAEQNYIIGNLHRAANVLGLTNSQREELVTFGREIQEQKKRNNVEYDKELKKLKGPTVAKKVLFVDEIQSDWHNAVQKEGLGEREPEYRLAEAAGHYLLTVNNRSVLQLSKETARHNGWDETAVLERLKETYRERGGDAKIGAPDAPYAGEADTYVPFVLKNMIREAAENGYDYIGWTTAQQQADRWSDSYMEGYRIEYDQEIPKFLKKYGKQWGAKVEDIRLSQGDTVHGMNITESMKESVLYEGQASFSLRNVPTQEEMTKNMQTVSGMGFVASLTGNEFAKGPVDLVTQVTSYFDSLGNIVSTKYGDIRLDKRGVKDSIAHGIGRKKASAFMAVPSILEKGEIIDYQKNWKGRGYDTAVFVAPIKIGSEEYFAGVIVNVSSDTNDYYLHEVLLQKKEDNASFKTGTREGDPSEALPSLLSLLQKVRDVKSESDVSYSLRDNDGTDARTMLSNALIETAQTDAERDFLQRYQTKIADRNKDDVRLGELRDEIREMMFAKGPRDAAYKEKMAKLQNQAKILSDRIARADKKLLELESTKPLKNVLLNETKRAAAKARTQGKEAAEAKLNRKIERLEADIEHRKDMRQRGIDQRKSTDLRERIKSIRSDFIKRLKKDNSIPPALVTSVIDVCDLLDPSGADQTSKAAEKYRNVRAALLEMKQAYEALKNNKKISYDFSSEFSQELADRIGVLAEAIGNKPLREMNRAQLEDVYDALTEIRHTLLNAKKILGEDAAITNYEASMGVVQDLETVKEKGLNRGMTGNKVSTGLREWMTNPLRAVREMTGYNENSWMWKLFNAIDQGLRKGQFWEMQAKKVLEPFQTGENRKLFEAASTKAYDFGLKDINGKKLKISKMQAMQILLTYERETQNANRAHLANTIIIPDVDYIAKGKYSQALDHAQKMAALDDETIAKLREGLSSEFDLAFMDAARKVFQMSADAVNETSLILKGRAIATEKAYIPYEVFGDVLNNDFENVAYDISIANMGMTKSVLPNSNANLVMRGLDTVMNKHMGDTAKYYGLAIPVRNFTKAYNTKLTAADAAEHDVVSVKNAIRDAWGDGAMRLIEQAVADVQGSRPGERGGLIEKLRSNLVQATLAANFSVWIKQAASYPTAGNILSTAALFKGLSFLGTDMKKSRREALWAEIDEHTASHYIRRQGLSIQELAEFSQSKGIGKKLSKVGGHVNPMNWIQSMDVRTTAALWVACKAEVKAQGLEVGSEEYWNAVTELYDKVIEDTQPMYDPLHRAEITKDKRYRFIMFQTQPIQNSGILREATMQLVDARKQYGKGSEQAKAAGKGFAKAVVSQLVSHTVFALMSLLGSGIALHKMGPYRDDDDKEVTWETLLKTVLKNIGKAYFGAILPVVGSYIAEAFDKFLTGNDYTVVSDMTLDAINSVVTLIQRIQQKSEKGTLTVDDCAKTIAEVAKYFGIPAPNGLNIAKSVIAYAKDIKAGKIFESDANRNAEQKKYYLYEAIVAGDYNVIDEYRDEKGDEWSSYIQTVLKEYDERITLAAEALDANDTETYERYVDEIYSDVATDNSENGFTTIRLNPAYTKDDVIKAIRSVVNKLREDDEDGEKESEPARLYTAADVAHAFETGDFGAVRDMAEGFKTKDAYETAVKSGLREYDPRVKQAAQARYDGDTSEYMRLVDDIVDDGYFSQELVVEAIKAETSAIGKEPKETDPLWYLDEENFSGGEGDYDIKAEDAKRVLATGNAQDIKLVYDSFVQDAIAKGNVREDAVKSAQSSFRTAIKNMFIDGDISMSQVTNYLKQYGGQTDENDIYWLEREWQYNKDNKNNPDAPSYKKYTTFYKAVQSGVNLKSVISEYTTHGVTAETMAGQITTYFKPIYKSMNNTERASLKGYLLNAYVALGYNRTKKSKDIDKWLTQ